MGKGPKAKSPAFLSHAGQINATLKALADAGLSDELFSRIRSQGQEDFVKSLVELAQRGGILELPDSEKKVSDFLGPGNYFGIGDWSREFWVMPTQDQLDSFPDLPWSLDLFDQPCPFDPEKKIRDTHWLFLGLDKVGDKPFGRSMWNSLAERREAFGKTATYFDFESSQTFKPAKYRWYLFLNTPPPKTFGRYPWNIREELPKEYQAAPTTGALMIHITTLDICKLDPLTSDPVGTDSNWICMAAENNRGGKLVCLGSRYHGTSNDTKEISASPWTVGGYGNLGIAASRIPGK